MNSIIGPIETDDEDDETDPEAPIPGTVFNERQARMLKNVVIIMGLMLLGGFALLIGIIAYRASQPATPLAPLAPVGVGVPNSAAPLGTHMDARKIQAMIPKGATFVSSTMNDRRLVITLQTPEKGLQLLLIDLKSWQILGQANLKPER